VLTIRDIIGNNSLAARRLKRYEERPEQLAMAEAVEEAIAHQYHLAVEAGTGVGKSFAYLVPAMLYLAQEQNRGFTLESLQLEPIDWSVPIEEMLREESVSRELEEKRRVIISTHTIPLQEQLFNKDLPFLQSILPFEITSILMKGRSNYLCLRRLAAAVKKSVSLFENSEHEELVQLSEWSRETSDGSLTDLTFKPSPEVWNEVACEHGNCLGRSCPRYNDCFYQKARRRAENASLLIVNHALLFSDLAIRRQGGAILPNYSLLVIDEAHTMEQAASDHLGLSITQGGFEFLFSRLYNERTGKGLLAGNKYEEAQRAVDQCRFCAEELFYDLDCWLQMRPGGNGRVLEPNIVGSGLIEALRNLTVRLHDVTDMMANPEDKVEYVAARNRTTAMAGLLKVWINQSDPDSVYWLERSFARKKTKVSMEAAPLEVGPYLREHLFSQIPTVIMTSATLSTGGTSAKNDGFGFFRSRIGLSDLETCRLGSPFNYRQQATLVLAKDSPVPEKTESTVNGAFLNALKRYIEETDGGAFVLFTSYALMKQALDGLMSWFSEKKYPVTAQSDGMPRSKMIEQFKKSNRSILFGTDSFWQGIDVPGESLRNVIITRLPFPVPSHPLTEARLETIVLRGGNSFNEYLLPTAILKFKQGFGRLIRSKTDQGLAVILDPRIITKSYGKQFLNSLPDCRIRVDSFAEKK